MTRKKYRCSYDIVYDVLTIINELQYPSLTWICQKSNLPYDRCKLLIKLLQDHGLIYSRNERNKRLFYLTENGYMYIGLYEEIQKIMPLRSIHLISPWEDLMSRG